MHRKANRIIICATIAVIAANLFLFQFCCVSGESMAPTLKDGDVLLVNKVSQKYQRMDIIVFKHNGFLLIKRVIGLPGETVKIENNNVYINNELIPDAVDVITEPGIASIEIVLHDDEYFVMGDNRGASVDSRNESVGPISKKKILGKVTGPVLSLHD